MPSEPVDWEDFYARYRQPHFIPGFEVREQLGSGSFGVVYKARRLSIEKDYAIKFLKPENTEDRATIARELDSLRSLAQLDHPHLVSIEDTGWVGRIPYVVMGYAGRETLRDRIAEGPSNRRELVTIFTQAGRGVLALHEHGIVHFDLKPANIFVRGEVARVGDYGLSRLCGSSARPLSLVRGTPYYMAPELLQRAGDRRSDIYSLGVILYECLLGRLPFTGQSDWEVLRKHESEAPEVPESLDARHREVLQRCLEKDPERRYESVCDLLHALGAPAAIGESIAIAPPSSEADIEPSVVTPPEAHPQTRPHQSTVGTGVRTPTSEQIAAIDSAPGPLRIVAGPGTGKTYALTERIRHFVEETSFEPGRILAVTFTVKAKDVMRRRLRDSLGARAGKITVRTLHSLALTITRRAPADAGLPIGFAIETSQRRQLELLLKTLDRLRLDPAFPRELLDPSTAERSIAHLKHSEPMRILDPDGSPEVRLCTEYDNRLRAHDVVTFDDLGVAALRVLRARPELLETLRLLHAAIFVDEFQDLNTTQFLLIRQLAEAHQIISVIGDDDQCVYAWRGADPDFLREFADYFPETRTLHLSANYRSTALLVQASQTLIDHNQIRIPKSMVSASSEAGARIRISRYDGAAQEVTRVLDQVAQLLERGIPAREVAVLARNNDLVQQFVVAARPRGVPLHAENPLRSSNGAKLLDLLRTVRDGPGDRFFQACVNLGERRLPPSEFRKRTVGLDVAPQDVEGILYRIAEDAPLEEPRIGALRRFLGTLQDARRSLESTSPRAVLEHLLDELRFPAPALGEAESGSVHDVVDVLRAVALQYSDEAGREPWAQFIGELEELSLDVFRTEEAVTVTTAHRSKGLEFDHVFILGVQGDKFPNFRFAAVDTTQLEEERRLFYVAMTRARKHLHVSNHALHACTDLPIGQRDGFIPEIPPDLMER